MSGFLGGSLVNNPPADAGDMGLIPGLGRSTGKGMTTYTSILAWEILGKPMDRGAWWATVHRVAKAT